MKKPEPWLRFFCARHLETLMPHCGSELAREGVMSVDIDAGCFGPFVSKPTPTLDFDQPRILHPPPIYCGSGLAREGVRSVDIDA
ncbi:MAG: hypothetical protein WCC61_21930, partial [Pseudomonas sp.]